MVFAATAIRSAQKAGVQTISLGSGGARNVPDGFDPAKAREQFIAFCKCLGPIGAEHKVMIVIGPLNRSETNLVNNMTNAACPR